MLDSSCDLPWANCLELPAMLYLWLPWRARGYVERTKICNEGWLFPVLYTLGKVSKSPKVPRWDLALPASTCLLSIVLCHWKGCGCTPQQCIMFIGWVNKEARGQDYYFHPGWWCLMEEIAPHKKDSICSIEEWFRTKILVTVPSISSPEPGTSDSYATLAHSTLSSPEPRVSIHKQNCVYWSFKRVPVSWVDCVFPCWTETLPIFNQIYCGCLFPAQMLWVWEPGLGFRPYPSQMESSTAEILHHIFSCNPWEQGESFCTNTLPTSFSVAYSECPWF